MQTRKLTPQEFKDTQASPERVQDSTPPDGFWEYVEAIPAEDFDIFDCREGQVTHVYRMGDAYEHGMLNCPRDPALSVHFYTGAAERGHAAGMMGLCAWYMVGAEPVLEKDEEEAYEWARRSADLGIFVPCPMMCSKFAMTNFE